MRKLDISFALYRCENGEKCLEYLSEQAETWQKQDAMPVLILLDLNLPGTTGQEVLKKIKQNPRLRKIPVTVITTSANPRDVEESYDNGANSYVLKPVAFDELLERLRTVMEFWTRASVLPDSNPP